MYYLRSKQRMITTLSGILLNNVHLLKNKITYVATNERNTMYLFQECKNKFTKKLS